MPVQLHRRRRLANQVAMTLAFAAAGFGLAWLAFILFALLWEGIGGLALHVVTEMTPPPGADGGGLLNAIAGSLMMTALASLIGTMVGLLAGTWLAEYGDRQPWLAAAVRFVNDLLLSAPSIVVGLFVYELLVVTMGHFSGWAGVAALALLVVPVVVRTTEDMLRLVPGSLREAAAALGAPKWLVIRTVVYRAARSGLLTGALLALARIAGETAPLLFTALNSQFWSLNMNAPIANLPVTIFQFALSPYDRWQQLAWTGALLVTAAILALNVVARILAAERSSER